MNFLFKFIILFVIFIDNSFALEKKKVLIMHSYHESFKWTDEINKGIKSTIQNGSSNIDFYIEYMDTKRYVDDKHYENLFLTYQHKYLNKEFDVIIASDNNAFNFLKKYSHILFKNSPKIVCGINHLKKEDIEHLKNFKGINEDVDIKRNFDLILKLHPKTENIYFITDTTTTGKEIKKEVQKITFQYPNKKVKFFVTDDVSLEELKFIVGNLPQNSAILFSIFFRDKLGAFFEYYEVPKIISKNTNAPLYSLWDFSLNNDVIGGFLTSGYFQGKEAGYMAKKVLDGKNFNDIQNMYRSPNQYMFDYKKIKKFEINEKLLPKSSFLINKEESFLRKHLKEILFLMILFFSLVMFIILLLINIRRREKAEKKISRQLKFQQDLIDNVNTPIYYKDENKTFLGCNKAFERLIHKKRKDIIGKTVYDIFSEKEADFFTLKDDALLQSTISQKYEGYYHFKGYQRQEVVFYKNLFYDDENKITGIIGAIFDITELKTVTKNLDNLNKNLEKEIEFRTIELQRTNEELEDSNEELQTTIDNLKQTQNKLVESEKMASLGSLVAGIAHEINTPVGIGLTGITHFIEESSKLMEDYANEQMTEEKFKNFLKNTDEISLLIKKNLERTAYLIKSFKQVAADQTSGEKREINLKEYLDEILFSISNITRKTNIDIKTSCIENANVITYPGAISQVITNLIINSIIHGFEKNEKGSINIDINKLDEETFSIRYIDNGKGIKAEFLPKIFDPFFTTNRQKGGTGLGLNIIYNIITNTLKGSIECKSEENKGVEFIITFKIENK